MTTEGSHTPVRGVLVQGTAVALCVDADGPLFGVMLTGPSGSGKSDLALRMIAGCAWQRTRLIADDGVMVCHEAGRLVAACHERIAGLIEARGIGIVPVASLGEVPLRLVARLGRQGPRLPEPEAETLLGDGPPLPAFNIDPTQLSAPAKLLYAARAVLTGHFAAVRHDSPK